MGVNRLESFSDGVIAVAITLLVLAIAVPAPDSLGGHSLGHALLHNWAHYAAYVVSFLTIGIIWINHHVMISRLREADHSIFILNLLLLMTIAILPFATDLMATYLGHADGRSLAAAVYAGCFSLMGIAFAQLNRHVLLRRAHLLVVAIPFARRRSILRAATAGVFPYVIATGLAFVSPYVTLGICAALAAFYAHPLASGRGLV